MLKTVFGHEDFRPMQAEIIANLARRRDTLAVMPTGSGKSLCYQLPALLFPGLTLVVSPLIALMQDQVTQLRALGVPAAFLNSTVGYRDYVETAAQVRRGQIKLLYTSPETLLRPETLVLLDHAQLHCLTIDEAHCISAWGHDFRPEYRQLLPVRGRYPQAVCAALTATATPRVQRDIQETLGFRHEDVFIAGFNRPNLYLEVQPRTDGLVQTLVFLEAHRNQSGIIYCASRQGVDRLAARLAAAGWPALPYHAGLDDATRRRHQARFTQDEAQIMVATIAFGMGINKANVRFVLHYHLPQSLEHYYQEIGRAGRDGLPAHCLLLFSRADLLTSRRFIEEGAEDQRPGREARLQAMVRYAETPDCRRRPLLAYFGEQVEAESCGGCDNCGRAKGDEAQIEVTEAAHLFLRTVLTTGQVFGSRHIIDVLRGSRGKRVLQWHHERHPSHGAGRARSVAHWKYLAAQFIRQGLLAQDMEHGGLRLTEQGRAALAGGRVFVPPEPRPVEAPSPVHDDELYAQLRSLRHRLAEQQQVPAFVIFHDRTLIEMATWLPQTMQSFRAIDGVGELKLKQYGEAFLGLIQGYCRERGLAERSRVGRPLRTADGDVLSSRSARIGQAFAAGSSFDQLQAQYGVQVNTLVQHLYRCTQAGQRFPPERIQALSRLPADEQARVLNVMAELGCDRLRPLYEALGESVPYEELHLLRVCFLCRQPLSSG